MLEDEYIVLGAAGQCGPGKIRPILQWPSKHIDLTSEKNFNCYYDSYVMARGDEENGKKKANRIAKNFPRFKHDKDRVIISTLRCTFAEAFLIKLINDCDGFLTSDDNSENDRMSVDDPNYVLDDIMKEYWKKKDEGILNNVKTKDDYRDEDQVLQRFVAPRRQKDHFVYDKNYDLRSILSEYFTVFVKKYALPAQILDKDIVYAKNHKLELTLDQKLRFEQFMKDKLRRVRMLILYSKLFGDNNPLQIEFNGKTISFKNSDGAMESINIPRGKIRFTDTHYEKKIKELISKLEGYEPIYKNDSTSCYQK